MFRNILKFKAKSKLDVGAFYEGDILVGMSFFTD